ncbi:fibritin neck whisker [Vibrio phage D479]
MEIYAIVKPVIQELRYVNGTPDPNQRPDQVRINWIKNGDPITGATGDTVSDGALNRPSTELQENILTTHNNTKAQQTIISELVDTVNELTGGNEVDFGTRITANEDDILALQENVVDIDLRLGKPEDTTAPDTPVPASGLFLRMANVETNVGIRNSGDLRNPTSHSESKWDDAWFIKEQLIGQRRGMDPNGNIAPGTNPTGIHANIDSMSQLVTGIRTDVGTADGSGSLFLRVKALEDSSAVGDVTQIRTEIGQTGDATADTIYTRLTNLETDTSDLDTDLTALTATVTTPTTGLVDVVASHTTEIGTLQTSANDNTNTITTVQQDIGNYDSGDAYAGTIKARLSAFDTGHTDLWNVVGRTAGDTGTLNQKVSSIETQLGAQAGTDPNTLWWYGINHDSAIGTLTNRTDTSGLTGLTDNSSLLTSLQEIIDRIIALEP